MKRHRRALSIGLVLLASCGSPSAAAPEGTGAASDPPPSSASAGTTELGTLGTIAPPPPSRYAGHWVGTDPQTSTRYELTIPAAPGPLRATLVVSSSSGTTRCDGSGVPYLGEPPRAGPTLSFECSGLAGATREECVLSLLPNGHLATSGCAMLGAELEQAPEAAGPPT